MKTVAFCTLGCKVNQYETEAMAELFKKRGYAVADFSEPADVYVINTCSVTSMSDRKSRRMIRRAKKQNSGAVVIVCGCYAQVAPEDVMSIDGVNLVIGTKDKSKIADEADRLTSESRESAVFDISKNHEFEKMTVSHYDSMTRAYIKVQDGCSQFCTYCIIPYARGPIRSRDPEDVIREARRLAEDGFTEIILVGIHIASYGLDLKTTSLADIILKINEIDKIKRIRLSSIEPMTLNSSFIEKISKADKLCRHFHLSLQSGCAATLERMNRRYTPQEYEAIVNSIREHFPDAAITTDVMVGFPGETDAEFAESINFVDKMKFAYTHIFQYSPRPGTPAAGYPDQVSPEVKEKRSKALELILEKNAQAFLERFVGQTMTVLFEQRVNGYYEGKTSNYINVFAPSDEELSFEYRDVLIERAERGAVYGHIV